MFHEDKELWTAGPIAGALIGVIVYFSIVAFSLSFTAWV